MLCRNLCQVSSCKYLSLLLTTMKVELRWPRHCCKALLKNLILKSLIHKGPSPISWCICLKCLPMETSEENVCCRSISCTTEMAWFNSVVLKRDVLSLAIQARCYVTGDHATYSPSLFRKAAYRQYVICYLGRNNHQILPSCVVRCIRRKRWPEKWDSESTGMMNYLCNKCNNITKYFLVLYQ